MTGSGIPSYVIVIRRKSFILNDGEEELRDVVIKQIFINIPLKFSIMC